MFILCSFCLLVCFGIVYYTYIQLLQSTKIFKCLLVHVYMPHMIKSSAFCMTLIFEFHFYFAHVCCVTLSLHLSFYTHNTSVVFVSLSFWPQVLECYPTLTRSNVVRKSSLKNHYQNESVLPPKTDLNATSSPFVESRTYLYVTWLRGMSHTSVIFNFEFFNINHLLILIQTPISVGHLAVAIWIICWRSKTMYNVMIFHLLKPISQNSSNIHPISPDHVTCYNLRQSRW